MKRTATTRIEQIDEQLMRAQEEFVRADRRNDLPAAAEAFCKLEALFDLRTRLPLQRPLAE